MGQIGNLLGEDKKRQGIWVLAYVFDLLLSAQFSTVQNVQDLREGGGLKGCMCLSVLLGGISMFNCVGTQQLMAAINRTEMLTHSKGKNLQAMFSTCH